MENEKEEAFVNYRDTKETIPYMLQRIVLVLCVFFSGILFTGCSESEAGSHGALNVSEAIMNLFHSSFSDSSSANGSEESMGNSSMEPTFSMEHATPRMTPHIIVDRSGYSVDTDKLAYVVGEIIPQYYSLIDRSTGEEALRGEIFLKSEAPGEAASGDLSQETLLVGIIDFSSWTQEGEYYLTCDLYGSSYSFSVMGRNYVNQFSGELEAFAENCMNGTENVLDVLELLTLCEWENSNINNVLFEYQKSYQSCEDLLLMIKEWILHHEYEKDDQSKMEQNIALLAKYSYLYSEIDTAFATECLQKASTMYGQLPEKNKKSPEGFWALTELYRASGNSSYQKKISDYKDKIDQDSQMLENLFYSYGAITYMQTRHEVDADLCKLLMAGILEAGELAGKSYEQLTEVSGCADTEEVLRCGRALLCANYVLQGYQYDMMIRNLLHYAEGRNLYSKQYGEDEHKGFLLMLQGWMCRLEMQNFSPEFYY